MSKKKVKLRRYQQSEVWDVRVLKIFCPVCGQRATIRKSNRKHREISDLYCACNDVECGHTYVLNLTFSHTISPSAYSTDLIQSMIDKFSPEQRQLALGLLSSKTA
ncbi:ogr/Delta-like zinc finger family protein [Providencia alcalifaciens]|uniref:ogr/Delta-like zinc finger family protein n=1 Tax=Providencia TaxID=586 RepID=UPI000587385C|nr:ogr/Delta-like zinc finger family protein [Providencia rustigianii]SUC26508.1 Ogr/Delta-like zinc finger [Providencia rustigianii]